jgi:hypothetical protein
MAHKDSLGDIADLWRCRRFAKALLPRILTGVGYPLGPTEPREPIEGTDLSRGRHPSGSVGSPTIAVPSVIAGLCVEEIPEGRFRIVQDMSDMLTGLPASD